MTIHAVVKNGKVVNVVEFVEHEISPADLNADPPIAAVVETVETFRAKLKADALIDVSGTEVGIGWTYDGSTFAAPA